MEMHLMNELSSRIIDSLNSLIEELRKGLTADLPEHMQWMIRGEINGVYAAIDKIKELNRHSYF